MDELYNIDEFAVSVSAKLVEWNASGLYETSSHNFLPLSFSFSGFLLSTLYVHFGEVFIELSIIFFVFSVMVHD